MLGWVRSWNVALLDGRNKQGYSPAGATGPLCIFGSALYLHCARPNLTGYRYGYLDVRCCPERNAWIFRP